MGTSNGVVIHRGRDSAQLLVPLDFLEMPGYVIRRLSQAYAAAWLRHVGPELTGPQFAVMLAIKRNPGVEQGSLAQAAALDRSTMVGVAKRLEQRGLINRIQPPEDGRKRLLYLTAAGEISVDDTNAKARELDALLLAGMDDVAKTSMWLRLNERSALWEELVAD